MTTYVRLAGLCAVLSVAAAAIVMFTASNTVPTTHVGRQQFAIDANALKPAACAALNLTSLVTGVSGTAGNDLVLGPSTGSTLTGGGGRDCIVGGGGNDIITGNGLTAGDVCIGGPGTDVFAACQTTVQ
jgi:Ca2+-binding RTX toxin-like protein